MRALLFILSLLVTIPAHAQSKLLQAHAAAATFTGLIDVVASPTAIHSLRAGSAAIAATGTQTLTNVRRASDSVACDFLVASGGGFGVTTAACNSSTQGGVSYSTFVGTDATASCTISGTAAACSSAAGTIHVSDLVTGVGITQPCVVTVTNGSTTATVIQAGGIGTSCGTVSVAETVTFQVAGFATEVYDQSGNTHHVTQATAANQPQFIPVGPGTSATPALSFASVAGAFRLSGTTVSVNQPFSMSYVGEPTIADTNLHAILAMCSGGCSGVEAGFGHAANDAYVFGGSFGVATGATAGALHAVQLLVTGSSSIFNVDGTDTTGLTAGASAANTNITIGAENSAGGSSYQGFWQESGYWATSFSSGNRTALCHNQFTFYGTATSC